ncbi:MAG: hypothetical protein SWK76_16955 [Actinomycetota bacterium]|nr:hypothetical protein [Actinomycetota bacterium]
MGYGLPAWNESTEITSARLQQITDSIEWHHKRISYPFDLDGNMIEHCDGIGKVEGYLFVDPYSYPGYAGAGGGCGEFRLNLPAGLFEELLFARVQPASGSNGALARTIKAEGAGGVNVFVYDTGGAVISGFAVWITAVGKLKSGVLP